MTSGWSPSGTSLKVARSRGPCSSLSVAAQRRRNALCASFSPDVVAALKGAGSASSRAAVHEGMSTSSFGAQPPNSGSRPTGSDLVQLGHHRKSEPFDTPPEACDFCGSVEPLIECSDDSHICEHCYWERLTRKLRDADASP